MPSVPTSSSTIRLPTWSPLAGTSPPATCRTGSATADLTRGDAGARLAPRQPEGTAVGKHTMGTCAVCGKELPARELVPGELIRPEIAEELARLAPGWTPDRPVCRADLARARA